MTKLKQLIFGFFTGLAGVFLLQFLGLKLKVKKQGKKIDELKQEKASTEAQAKVLDEVVDRAESLISKERTIDTKTTEAKKEVMESKTDEEAQEHYKNFVNMWNSGL